jgi:hypothetical protein
MVSPQNILPATLLLVAAIFASGQEGDEPLTVDLLKERAAKAVKEKDQDLAVRIIEQTVEIDSKEGARLALRIVEKMKFSSRVAEAAERAITEMASLEVQEFVLHEASASIDWRLRVILLGVITHVKDERAFRILVNSLRRKEELLGAAAAQSLGLRGDKRAIGPLIEVMVKLDRKKGLVWEHCQASLCKLTGKDLDLGIDFQTWWEAHGGGSKEPPPDPKPPEGGKKNGEKAGKKDPRRKDSQATFFGLKITCQKIVFIIDVSGSMEKKDPPPEDNRTRTGREPKDYGEERRRITRAQRELSRTIRSLHRSVEFNIIAYSDLITIWSTKGLRKATSDNMEKAVKFVERFDAAGTTWTDTALAEAYRVNRDAYCFYLLSDGTPTHEGGEIPGDTEAIIEEIYRMVPELDIYRRVRIHTLGFRDANVEFMERLAEMTGGSYLDIQ